MDVFIPEEYIVKRRLEKQAKAAATSEKRSKSQSRKSSSNVSDASNPSFLSNGFSSLVDDNIVSRRLDKMYENQTEMTSLDKSPEGVSNSKVCKWGDTNRGVSFDVQMTKLLKVSLMAILAERVRSGAALNWHRFYLVRGKDRGSVETKGGVERTSLPPLKEANIGDPNASDLIVSVNRVHRHY
ncbi:unnamed protein product [Sphenostylis stenocarpa]|uniref:Uncharacterized protein n=1 Tax=Sphenostylis stenocarpa TaxID=92480 RepID=A0AA86V6Q9_9FABA|nr:unnamed protein product [Sphenostylis stenocarpa]